MMWIDIGVTVLLALRIALIWSDRVNTAKSVGMFL